jgi:NAD(P)H-flavin reductase
VTDLVSLPVLSVQAIAAHQAFVVVDVAGHPAIALSHVAAGQYVKVGFFDDDVARPVALANRPGTGTFELLLKSPASVEGDERLVRLLTLQKGDRVDVGVAQGKGFPVDASRGGSLWLFAVGSGIAPLKAVVEQVIAARNAWSDVVVFYGVRDAADLVFRDRFATWAGLSVRVVPVVSRPGPQWDGKRGYVQDHLPQSFEHPDKVTAFVCGLPEMERAVAQALLERGIGPEQIFRNW